MTLPTGVWPQGAFVPRFGIVLALFPLESEFNIEIQRAPDDGGGDPDVGSAVTVAINTPGSQVYVDILQSTDDIWHYRWRHVRDNYSDGAYTPWIAGRGRAIPRILPPLRRTPLLDASLSVDPITGELLLEVNAEQWLRSVKWEIDTSGSWPDLDDGGTTCTALDGDGDASIATAIILGAEETARCEMWFYDELSCGGNKIGSLRIALASTGIVVDCQPVLDEDDAVLNLYPNRSTWALAVYYKVYTTGTPTKADVKSTGTLSTDELIETIHTFTTDGERVQVGVVPVAEAGGGGTDGDLKIVSHTYNAADDGPTVTWNRYVPTAAGTEGVQVIAVDDGTTVKLLYRTYVDGATPPSFSDTGLTADPLVVNFPITRPAEGVNATVLEFYAEDADGNPSSVEPIQVRVDGNLKPTGNYQTDLDRSSGEPEVAISTSDPDTGSWRLRVKIDSYEAIQFDDADANEFSGNSFNGEKPDLSSYKLTKGEALYCELQFFRTTSTTDSVQETSMASEVDRFTVSQIEETENSIRIGGYQWYLTQTSGGPTWTLGVSLTVKGAVASVRFAYSYYDASATSSTARSYTVDGSSDFTHILENGSGGVQVFDEGDGIGFSSPPFVFSTPVVVTPYDAVTGGGNAGQGRRFDPPDYDGVGAVGAAAKDGSNTYRGDALEIGDGLTLSQVAGRPAVEADFIPSGTPNDGDILVWSAANSRWEAQAP